MKVLEVVNKKGIKRYYSEFHCTPFFYGDEVCYAVDAVFHDCECDLDTCDCLEVFADLATAMTYCVELVKQLENQSDCDSGDPLYLAYFSQVREIGG